MRLLLLLVAFAGSVVMANPAEDAPVNDAPAHMLGKRFEDLPANVLGKRSHICSCSCGGCVVSATLQIPCNVPCLWGVGMSNGYQLHKLLRLLVESPIETATSGRSRVREQIMNSIGVLSDTRFGKDVNGGVAAELVKILFRFSLRLRGLTAMETPFRL
jgi:hypothetical protein